MKKVKVGKHILEIYDSIDELPVLRFHKYNKMLLIDSGVGSDLNDVNNHVERAMIYLKTNPDLAVKELDNLRQSIFLVMSEVSPKHMAFCALVRSIDGEECNDISDEGLKTTLDRLKDVSHTEMTDQMESVKKKIDTELSLYFPSDNALLKEYFDKLKARTIMVLDSIITGENKENEIKKVTDSLITYTKPYCFNGRESVEIKHDKEFEDMCFMLSEKLNVEPKKFTVLEYYNAFEYLKKWKKIR